MVVTASESTQLRQVRPGLTVDLYPADWLMKTAVGFDRCVHLVVSTVHEPVEYRDGVGWVRVWGHTTRCASRPDHGPCVDVVARVGALLDALEGQ
ncbi:hypothetical protein ABNF97_09475 [Plantactinospora sp. B6F1]|uniref:hypothetical protein n=1 Tax=Plantactinospora sp. B6F1 TaxID=3158971 RepID=UPI0032D8C196